MINPVKINFAEEVSFDVTGKKKQFIRQYYPEPYYRIENNKAIAKYGNYVQELFELKKKGVLMARGLFGSDSLDFKPRKKIKLTKVESLRLSKRDSMQLIVTWKQFASGIINKDQQKIRSLSFDSVVCSVCEGFSEPYFYNDIEPIDSLINSFYRNLPGTELWKQIKSGKFRIYINNFFRRTPRYFLLNPKEKPITYEVCFTASDKYGGSNYEVEHIFEFIKIKDQFIFNGMRSGEY